jgi:hypothetical protein
VFTRSSFLVRKGSRDPDAAVELNYRDVITFAKIADGTSKTAMVTEKRIPVDAYNGRNPALPDDDRGWSDGWDLDTLRSTICPPIPDTGRPVGNEAILPGSAHTAGVITAFADGSVHLINFDIDVETWNRIGHRADGESIASDAF